MSDGGLEGGGGVGHESEDPAWSRGNSSGFQNQGSSPSVSAYGAIPGHECHAFKGSRFTLETDAEIGSMVLTFEHGTLPEAASGTCRRP